MCLPPPHLRRETVPEDGQSPKKPVIPKYFQTTLIFKRKIKHET
jgi:hypothetical protein